MSEVLLTMHLDDSRILDKEVIRLLEECHDVKERKDLIVGALLYYNRAPQFLVQEQFRLLLDENYKKYKQLLEGKGVPLNAVESLGVVSRERPPELFESNVQLEQQPLSSVSSNKITKMASQYEL